MIQRYTLPEMGNLWSDYAKYKSWLDVELAVCYAWMKKGKIPLNDYRIIVKKADFNIKEIEKIEEKVRHDVIAFLTSVAKKVGKSSRFIHMGMTSNDMLDTAMSLRLLKACDIVEKDLKNFIRILKNLALKHKNTVMIGRTHNIHAEPTTFGLKVLIWYFEMKRNLDRLLKAKEEVKVGKISGAVGNYANISPVIEKIALKKLGLKPADATNQIIQRDRYAFLMSVLAIIAGGIEKIATEIRNLQHTEILEVEEPFSKGQKGSSAMPHKRNPVVCEQLSGLTRLVRTNTLAAFENIALWHERDISHSSVERVIIPDNFILINYMLNKISWIMENLNVYPENMKKNLNHLKGLVFSQRVLLALIEKGMTREQAYKIVQENAMKIWAGEKKDLKTLLLEDKKVRAKLSEKEIEDLFDINYYLKNIDEIYKRV